MSWSWDVDDIIPDDWPDNICRASGLVKCEKCGKTLDLHYQPAKQSCPSLIIDCDGAWLKL